MLSLAQKVIAVGALLAIGVLLFLFDPIFGTMGLFLIFPFACLLIVSVVKQ